MPLTVLLFISAESGVFDKGDPFHESENVVDPAGNNEVVEL